MVSLIYLPEPLPLFFSKHLALIRDAGSIQVFAGEAYILEGGIWGGTGEGEVTVVAKVMPVNARSRRPTSVPSLQYESSPGMMDVGGLFFYFEAVCSAQIFRNGKRRKKCLYEVAACAPYSAVLSTEERAAWGGGAHEGAGARPAGSWN